MLHLKVATKEDYSDILPLVKEFHLESPFKGLYLHPDAVKKSFDVIMANPKDYVIILLMFHDEAVGMIVGGVASPLFTEDRIATELAWYVLPEYRGTRKSLELFKAYEHWA